MHENLMHYTREILEVYPQDNSNIVNHVKIRKGSMSQGWSESEITVEGSYSLPQSSNRSWQKIQPEMPQTKVDVIC